MAITVTYSITSGELPITVSLIGSGEPDNVHYSYGQYSFECVPDGNYDLQIVDDAGCSETSPIELCPDCPEGYEAVGSNCIYYDITNPTYTSTSYTIVRIAPYRAYSAYGCLLFSDYELNGTGTYTRFGYGSSYWSSGGNTLNGPMNRSCVWASGPALPNQDIGFSICITIAEEKTYYVGVGCDNWSKIKVNGTYVIEQDLAAIKAMVGSSSDTVLFTLWYIYPVYLSAGQNVIEIFGHNRESIAAVGIEVYNATPQEIMNATSDADLGSTTREDAATKGKIIFRSTDLVGQPLQYEYTPTYGYHGYSCSEGYALDTCGAEALCVQKNVLPYCGETTTTSTTMSEQDALIACLDDNFIFEETLPFTPATYKSYKEKQSIIEDADYYYMAFSDSYEQQYKHTVVYRYKKSDGSTAWQRVTTANAYYGDNHKVPTIFITSTGALLLAIEQLPGNYNHNSAIEVFRWADPSDLTTYTSSVTGVERLAYPEIHELNGEIIITTRLYWGGRGYNKSTDDGLTFGSYTTFLQYTDGNYWAYSFGMFNNSPIDGKVIIPIDPSVVPPNAWQYLTYIKTDFTNFYALDGTNLGTSLSVAEVENYVSWGIIPEGTHNYLVWFSKIFGEYIFFVGYIGTGAFTDGDVPSMQIGKVNINTGVTSHGDVFDNPFPGLAPEATLFNICGTIYFKACVGNAYGAVADNYYYKINNDLSVTFIYKEEGNFEYRYMADMFSELTADYDVPNNKIRVFRHQDPDVLYPYTTTTSTTTIPPTTTTTTTAIVTLLTGLVSVWELNETSGTTVTDSHGGLNGTNTGATVNVAGKIGTCYDFESSENDYIDVPDNNGFSFTDGSSDVAASISMWINPESFDNTNGNWLISKRGAGSLQEWQLILISGEIRFYLLNTDGTVSHHAAAAHGMTAGNWYHIVVTYDGSESINGVKIYKNNVAYTLTPTTTGSYTGMTNTSSQLSIGRRGFLLTGVGDYDGLIDQVAIWKGRELSASDISELYNSGNGLAYTSWT